mmetsp:Transcript_22254/g.66803  ORF Transcript_22254/g.66803 Transcript_22254/m.66803 type:complete len:325 (-) Transcript_22254:23-997(-)
MPQTRSQRKAQQSKPPPWRVLLLATRPNTLAASFTPVLVGHVIGAELGHADARAAFAFWAFACLIQIGTNLHNDYADFVKGADTSERVGQARATQKGWLTPRQTASLAASALAAAAAVGVSLALRPGCGRWMGWVCATSVFNAVAYTGGPFPLGYVGLGWVSLGYWGLGDVFVFAYFGLVATLAPYYLALPPGAPRACPPRLSAVAGALGCLATAIIVVNNLRDRATDVKAGKRTLAVRFGGRFARGEYALLLGFAYLAPAALVATGEAPLAWLAPLASLPLALKTAGRVFAEEGAALNKYVGGTAKLQLVYGALLVVGVACSG